MLTEDPWDLDYFLENDLDLYVSQVVDPCTAVWCATVECHYACVAAPITARLPDQLTSVLFHGGYHLAPLGCMHVLWLLSAGVHLWPQCPMRSEAWPVLFCRDTAPDNLK